MEPNKRIQKFKNEDGTALVLAMMVLLVLSVLGAMLGTLTVGSYRLSANNQDYNSAYYIAEAGANMAYEEIKSEVENLATDPYKQGSIFMAELEDLFEEVSLPEEAHFTYETNEEGEPYFQEQSGDVPKASVKVVSESPHTREGDVFTKEYTIQSTGIVAGKERKVEKPFKVTWQQKIKENYSTLPVEPEGAVLLGANEIILSGNNLAGKVYVDSTLKNITLGWGDIKTAEIIYPKTINLNDYLGSAKDRIKTTRIEEYIFDEIPYINIVNNFPEKKSANTLKGKILKTEDGDITLKGNNLIIDSNITKNYSRVNELTLTSDIYIPVLQLKNDMQLKINTGGKNINIIVDDLLISNGDVDILNGGTVSIYVTRTMSFGSHSSINANVDRNGNRNANQKSNSNLLNLYYAGFSEANFTGLNHFYGHVFVKNAPIKASNTNINGFFVSGGKKILFDGGNTMSSMYLIAPKAEIILSGSYGIEGTVISRKFKMDGGSRLYYKDTNLKDFPFGSSPKKEDNELEKNVELIRTTPAIEQ